MMTEQEFIQKLREAGIQVEEQHLTNLYNSRAISWWRVNPQVVIQTIKDVFGGDLTAYDLNSLEHGRLFAQTLILNILKSDTPEQVWDIFGEHSSVGYAACGMRLGLAQSMLDFYSEVNQQISPVLESRYFYYGQMYFYYEKGLFLADGGYLQEAEATFRFLLLFSGSLHDDIACLYQVRQTLAEMLILQGRLQEAYMITDSLTQLFEGKYPWIDNSNYCLERLGRTERRANAFASSGSNPFARRALTYSLLGNIHSALADFKTAEKFQMEKLVHHNMSIKAYYEISTRGVFPEEHPAYGVIKKVKKYHENPYTLKGEPALHYADLLTRLGKVKTAQKIATSHQTWQQVRQFPRLIAHSALILSDTFRLQGDFASAEYWLESPLAWSEEVGNREFSLRAQLSLARLRLAQARYPEAQAIAQTVYEQADHFGYGLYSIDARIPCGRAWFLQGEFKTAFDLTERAYQEAGSLDCHYLWGVATAAQLLGEIAAEKTSKTNYHIREPRHYFEIAVQVRHQLRDPRLSNSQTWLDRFPQEGE